MTHTSGATLLKFGFAFPAGSTHLARSYMLDELQMLLDYVDDPNAGRADYMAAVIEENCLGKRSGQTRKLTFKYLSALYGLDPALPLFRTLRFFWSQDMQGQPLLALLCACARDTLLMQTSFLIRELPIGSILPAETMAYYLSSQYVDRLSAATLGSTTRNLLATWTKAGYLAGKSKKTRVRAPVTPGATAYALYLNYLLGERGEILFQSRYAKVLDCPMAEAVDLADSAARRGWIVFKHVGNVIEVDFPVLLTPQERASLHE